MERRGRKESIITLIIMIIIGVVIASWLSGLWSCEEGRKELTDVERSTISDYVNSISVLVQQSNKISYKFFIILDRASENTRENLDDELLDIIEESKVVLERCGELIPPEFYEVAHGYLGLVFETRNKAYEDFRPAIFNALQDLDLDISTAQITKTFLYMFMSDEIYLYFQDKLKESGENLGIYNLTIIDSVVLKDKNLTDNQSVMSFISKIKSVPDLQARRGVAVIDDTIEFNPEVKNNHGDYWVLGKGNTISVAIAIENQGNVIENNVKVTMKYMAQDNISETKEYIIETIKPSQQKTVTISGYDAYPGRKCELEINAGPVPDEAFLGNNKATFRFIMED